MVMTVAWLNCLLMVSCMRRSVAESTEAVASSSNRIWDRLQHAKKLRGVENTAKVVIEQLRFWWHAATLFIYFTLIEHTNNIYIYYSSRTTLDLLIASAQYRACLTASRRATV